MKFYRQAFNQDPQFALAYARLSLLESYSYKLNIELKQKVIADAEWAAKQALAINPNLPEANLAMGYVKYYGHHNYAGALDKFEQIPIDFRNNNAEVIGAISFIHRRQGKWHEALTGLKHASKLDPRNPRWLYEVGSTLMDLREYAQAIQEFDQALALEPKDYNAAAFKVITLIFAGKPLQLARRILADIPPDSSQKGLIPALLFEIERLSHRPESALNALNDASGWIASPSAFGREPAALLRAQAWAAQGNRLHSQQEYKKARIMLKTALQAQPKNSSLWSFLGLAEAGLGQKSQAIGAGIKATSLTPVTKDALAGPSCLVTLAKIYAQVDEPHQRSTC